MTSALDLAAEISQLIRHVKRGSLVVPGGILFDEGETLEIWDPGNAAISPGELSVSTAAKVRWEWFCLRPPQDA